MKSILFIIVLQLLYVPLLTMRTIFMVKDLRRQAAIVGLFEALVYILGLYIVFTEEQNIVGMIVYAVGFSIGILIGTKIEEKLAIGYLTVIVNIPFKNEELIEYIRLLGYGITVFDGEGRDSTRCKLEILTERAKKQDLIDTILKYQENAFIISYEIREFHGGYLLKNLRKARDD